MYRRIENFTFYFLIFLYICCCNGERKHLFFTELCSVKPHPKIHLSIWKSEGDPAATLSLSKDDYPFGLNCCLNATSDHQLVVEISDINLPVSPDNSCLDHLQISSETDTISLCHQADFTHPSKKETASDTLEAFGEIMICFNGSASSIDVVGKPAHDATFGFTLRLIAFVGESNGARCWKSYDGFKCHGSHYCLPEALNCDIEEDCPDGSDELANVCKDVTTVAEIDNPTVGISLQGAITLGGIAVIVCAVLVMCMWQCLLKMRPRMTSPQNSNRPPTEVTNVPMAIYTVPIATNPSLVDMPTSSANDGRIIISCTRPKTEDLPPAYDTLYGSNK